MWWIALGLWTGCSGGCGNQAPWSPPELDIDTTPNIHLAESVPFTELSVPDDSRDGLPVAEQVRMEGSWTRIGGAPRGGTLWSRPNPFRPRGMFFTRPQKGMKLMRENRFLVPYRIKPGGGGLSWNHDQKRMVVHTREPEPPPALLFDYTKAKDRERRLHYALAKAEGWVADKAAFVRGATVQDGWTSRQGLLLPAPGLAAWEITIPDDAVLTMNPGLVHPEFSDLEPSDGCEVKVSVGNEASRETVFQRAYTPGEFTEERVDLSKWAGKNVRLEIETLPGPTTRYDFCFVGSPIVHKRKKRPRRVILIFVDTLRPDHLSTYGYERETTPNLDALAKGAAVFTEARSIAPWTLPSARTMITGYQPELFEQVESLPARLGREGFATGMVAGNVYLSANFGMNADWDHHEVGMFPPANEVTDDALAWLDVHEGQDALLQVHYMSAHLPYQEPLQFRTRYAGIGPNGLQDSFALTAVRTAIRNGLDDDGKQYMEDRYDNCVSWIDHELQRIYDRLNPEDIVIFTSDHGEEFWDHGGFEHGHTLHDELLRIPLVIKGPGIRPGTVDVPVSLLDLTPTIYDMLDLESPSQGVSLVEAAGGQPEALEKLASRDQAVGRPLYGRERWGVISDSKKWISAEGRERVFDLVADPGETTNLSADVDLAPYRAKLGEVLETRSGVAYRFLPNRNATSARKLDLIVKVPGGIDRAWFGADALQRSKGTVQRLDEERVQFTWHKGYRGTREAYVMPTLPVEEVTRQVTFELRQGEANFRDAAIPQKAAKKPGPKRYPLHSLNIQDGVVKVTWAIAPAVDEKWMALDATDSETEDWLEKLGYTDKEDDGKNEAPEGDKPPPELDPRP